MKPPIKGILTIAIAAFVWNSCVSVQVEHKSTSKSGSMSAYASCYEKSTGRLVGSNKSVTSVLTSPDGLYRAYAESEAVASQSPSAANAECQNTSKLFVSDPKSDNFRPVLVVKPSPEALGNSIDLVDWSPNGNRLLLAEGVWQWGSDAGGIMVRIYDAESKNLSRESLVDEAFSIHVGKNCAGVFYPVGFSSSGQVVLTAGPFFEEGEDKPMEDSCVQQKGIWLLDTSIPAVTQLPGNYRVGRYAKVLPAPGPSVADSGASPLKNRIPPPDPNKYRSVRDARDWQNPYLVVQANGIRPISAEAPTMSPADVVAYLQKLPSTAWPYGLVVAVQENGLRAPGDDDRIRRNREELVRLLEKAGVKVDLWPSA